MMSYVPRYGSEIRLSSVINLSKGKKQFGELDSKDEYYFDSATEAIAFLLSNLTLKSTSIVGVPLYVCSSVPQAVKTASLTLKFLDMVLDDSGYDVNFSQFEGVDVLIFIHYFGMSYQKIDAIKNAYPGLIIIEDCSHISHKEYVPNRYADAAIFSFNLHKPISCGVGGCLVINGFGKIADVLDNYKKLSTVRLRDDWKRFLGNILKSYAHSQFIQSCSRSYLENRRSLRSRHSPHQVVIPRKLSPLSSWVLGNQYFVSMDRDVELNYLKIPKELRLRLTTEEVKRLIYFPLFLPSKKLRDDLNNMLHEMAVDSFILWENCLFNATFYAENYIDCVNTKVMLDRVLYLPAQLMSNSRYSLKFQAVLRVVDKLMLDSL